MRTLGLVGGTSWVSSLEYYRLLNEEVRHRIGGHEAARLVLYSLNFGDVMRAKEGDPEQRRVRPMVVEAAQCLKRAGAEGLMLCANTLHWFAEDVERAVSLPLIHIAEATGSRIRDKRLRRVGLLGTLPTMEEDFYRSRLETCGLEVLVPDAAERQYVHGAIFEELVLDVFKDETRSRFIEIIHGLAERGAEGIILGCTEIPLLVKPEDCSIPLFDTLRIHVEAGVDFALSP